MKNNIVKHLIIGTFAVFTLSSCEDYLDKQPDDQLTLEMVFNNDQNTLKWLANIYSYIPDTYSYGTAEPAADDLAPSPGWEQFNFKMIQYQKGNWSALSEGGFSYWTSVPKAIRAAYIFMENVKVLPKQDLETVNRMKAECQFLIAYYHSLMLMTYGSVPIIRSTYDASSDVMGKQEPFYAVVDWIDEQLMDVAEKLPAKYLQSGENYGRATSIMCYAVRARLLTFAASDLVNGNEDFSNFKNCDGVPIFSSTKDMRRWDNAVRACKLLIDKAEEAGHILYKEYLSDGVTIDPFMSYQNVTLKRWDENNFEILMDRPYSGGYGGWDKNSYPRGVGGFGALGITQSLVDDFFMKDGKSPVLGYDNNDKGSPVLNPDCSLYKEKGFSTENDTRKTRWREGSSAGDVTKDDNIVAPSGTFNMYCNREPRFYVSVLTNDAWCRYGNRNTDYYMNGKDGGPSHDSPYTGYLLRKKVDPSANPVTGVYKPRGAILFRLAEFYLSYAEALNEVNYTNNQAEILKYVNLIRERAGIPQYGVVNPQYGLLAVPANQAEMRRLIRQERHVELNNEFFIRFDDIRRWKEGWRIDGKSYGMNRDGKQKKDDPAIVDGSGIKQSFYLRTWYMERHFISYWWPIPQADIEKNPNLRQMPGWND